jgi:tRNA 2-thiouridine synthesizing protein A
MDKAEVTREVDARGQKCPVPILWAKKALAAMESGQVLRVLATDPAAVGDFRFFSRQTGNTLLDQTESAGEYTIYLRRK